MTTNTTTSTPRDGLLRTALRGNAAFSTVSAIIVIVFARQLAAASGIGAPLVFIVIGVGLLPWAFFLYQGSRGEIAPSLAWAAIAGDALWVLASIVLLVSGALPLTTAGVWGVILLADVVAVFGIVQYVGLRRML